MLHTFVNYRPFLASDQRFAPLFVLDADRPLQFDNFSPVYSYPLADNCGRVSFDFDTDAARFLIEDSIRGVEYRLVTPVDTVRNCCGICTNESSEPLMFLSDVGLAATAPARHIFDHILILAFSIAALGRGVLLLHASAVICADMGVAFVAPSGTGKSTHARSWLVWPDCSILNDDAPAVRIEDDRPMLYGTPWSGKGDFYLNRMCPLSAVVRIVRAESNLAVSLSGIEALSVLIGATVPILHKNRQWLDGLCNVLDGLLTHIAVSRMECLPDSAAARVCRQSLFGSNR